jgi:NADPH2:quinone reductase
MKAAVYYQNGAPDVLKYEDVPDPTCPPNGLIMRVEAVSIEGGDVSSRAGAKPANVPHIVGYQTAGEVLEIGERVTEFKVGDKVVSTGANGSHASKRAVSARTSWKIPDGLDTKIASVIPIPFGTADNCLLYYGKLKAGDTCFIQSGASGVGMAAIQIAKAAGARVIVTASSDARLDAIRDLGVDHGINSAKEDVVAEVMRITEKKGVDVALDGNGGTSLQQCVQVLGWLGRATFIGVTARESMKIDVRSLMGGNRQLMGLAFGAETGTPRVKAMVQSYIDDIAAGKFKVLIDREFPLSEAAAAHAYIESRQAVGRVLLIP